MTLFGPDPDEDEYDISSGMADANEVARLIELNVRVARSNQVRRLTLC